MIEPMSNSIHPKIMLISRMIGFYHMQLGSPKFCVRYLLKLAETDMRTNLGRTLSYAASSCGISNTEFHKLNPGLIKRRMKYAEAPDEDNWQVQLACELKLLRDDKMVIEGFNSQEIEELFNFVCIS